MDKAIRDWIGKLINVLAGKGTIRLRSIQKTESMIRQGGRRKDGNENYYY
jgi:hypothetical protein